jgi:hypothetical protein
LEFDTGMLSTMNSGWLLLLNVFWPRMMMLVEPPGVPPPVIVTPEIFPWTCWTRFIAFVVLRSSEVICCCAVPSCARSRSTPSAVTTTPVSRVAATVRLMSRSIVPPLRTTWTLSGA